MTDKPPLSVTVFEVPMDDPMGFEKAFGALSDDLKGSLRSSEPGHQKVYLGDVSTLLYVFSVDGILTGCLVSGITADEADAYVEAYAASSPRDLTRESFVEVAKRLFPGRWIRPH